MIDETFVGKCKKLKKTMLFRYRFETNYVRNIVVSPKPLMMGIYLCYAGRLTFYYTRTFSNPLYFVNEMQVKKVSLFFLFVNMIFFLELLL